MLQLSGIRKQFGPTVALDGVDLLVQPGEVHALIGENGAGKSTLMNVLAGEVQPEAGTMTLDGQPSAETKQLTEALLSMGFERREIREAIKSLDTSETTLEQKIRLALRILGKPL